MAQSKTVEKTLKILELISSCPEGIPLSKIYKTLNLPKATVYDILQTLYKEDAVYYKDPNLKTYVIGSKMFIISQAYTKNSNMINFSRPKLREFSEKYSLTVFAHKRVENRSVIIYKHESQQTKITTNDVGTTSELDENIVGQTFMAFMNEEKLAAYYDKIECKYDNESFDKLKNKVEKIKNDKYVVCNGDEVSYKCSYAVPVLNFENKVVGVISSCRVIENESDSEINKQITEMIEIAKHVSEKQGYSGDFYENIEYTNL